MSYLEAVKANLTEKCKTPKIYIMYNAVFVKQSLAYFVSWKIYEVF